MGTIVERPRADGSIAYLARVRVKKAGKVIFEEFETFDRRKTAAAWIAKLEKELKAPGGVEAVKARDRARTLGDAIDLYVQDTGESIGRTKAQVLRSLKDYAIADMACEEITSTHIYDLVKELGVDKKPQTVNNYLSHLRAVFTVARPAWGIPLDVEAMKDAMVVSKRFGAVKKSASRERRPTLDELDRLLTHFEERRRRVPQMLPMNKVVVFALFSTRRLEEITRIQWADLEEQHSRVLVRDMKNPGEKIGNHVWCDLPEPALQVIRSMPKTKPEIFPYSTDAIGANFTRACQLLGIEDLHFHDLRHEGVSRLFEMGNTIPHVAAVSGHRSWSSLKRYSHIRGTGDRYEGWAWIERVSNQYGWL